MCVLLSLLCINWCLGDFACRPVTVLVSSQKKSVSKSSSDFLVNSCGFLGNPWTSFRGFVAGCQRSGDFPLQCSQEIYCLTSLLHFGLFFFWLSRAPFIELHLPLKVNPCLYPNQSLYGALVFNKEPVQVECIFC